MCVWWPYDGGERGAGAEPEDHTPKAAGAGGTAQEEEGGRREGDGRKAAGGGRGRAAPCRWSSAAARPAAGSPAGWRCRLRRRRLPHGARAGREGGGGRSAAWRRARRTRGAARSGVRRRAAVTRAGGARGGGPGSARWRRRDAAAAALPRSSRPRLPRPPARPPAVAPSSHSARNQGLSASADCVRMFCRNCGSWAESHSAIASMPSAKPALSRSVYRQSWKYSATHGTAPSPQLAISARARARAVYAPRHILWCARSAGCGGC